MTLQTRVTLCCTYQPGHQSVWTNVGVDTDQEWWECSTCHRPNQEWMEGTDAAVLNFFKGGPLDGSAYDTPALLDERTINLPVAEYAWTPEVIVSELTGASARVWVHHTLVQGSAGAERSSNAAVRTVEAGESGLEVDAVGGYEDMNSETLEDRRKMLKLSRGVVAKEAGLTQAKVYRIEKGGGRTTEEETAVLTAALDRLAEAVKDPA